MSASSPAAAAAPAPAGALGAALAGLPFRSLAERAGYALFALFIFFICFTFLRPAPYDFLAIPTLLLWLALGLRLHRAALPFVAFLLLYHLGLVLALIPYLDEPDPTNWTFQSVYLMVTCVFFVMFFGERARRRVSLALDAYVASCLFAAVAGIASYFGVSGALYTMDGRAAGVFEDPNVLGSFLVLGAIRLTRGLLVGESRRPILSVAALLVIAAGIFLSFSRGSWGALVVGTAVMAGFTWRSSGPRIRRRIVVLGTVVAGLGLVALLGLLSVESVSKTFSDRATVTKDYDEGETGRFGNQRRSLPLLVERPEGFGPLRFRLRFGLEPHNSYIGGFANGGWLGGFAFLFMALATVGVGIRLCLVPSPYRDHAQVAVPATLMFFLQAMQIDIDHWRHVYLLLGMVWGLECARARWLAMRPVARPKVA